MNKYVLKTSHEIIDRCDISSFKNKTIMITGANGLIGGFLTDFFHYLNTNHDYNIKLLLTSLSKTPDRILHLLDNKNIEYQSIDLSQSFEFKFDKKIDYCFYCAGYAQPAKFLSNPIKTFSLNTTGVNLVFDNIYKQNKNATCIFLSSSEVYTMNKNEKSHSEDDLISISMQHKRYPYVLGKVGGESIVNSFNDLGYKAKSVRVSLCYGPGVSMEDSRVMSELVDKGINQPVIKLFDEGTAARRYMHISDFCIALFNITLYGEFNTYNVGGTEETSIYEMAKCIGEVFNKSVQKGISNNNVSVSAPKRVWVSLDRYENEFESIITKPFKEGLTEFINWYKDSIKK